MAKFLADVQRAHYSKRRKEIWEALHPEPSVDYGQEDGGDGDPAGGTSCPTSLDYLPDGRKKGPQHYQSFAAATAEVTGQSKAQINRSVARAEAIGDDLIRLGPMWAGVGVKNAWGVADVQRPFNDRSTDAYYTARRAEIREALTPSAPTEWQDDEGEGDSVGGNEIPTNEADFRKG